ncbi:hypothetical protein QR680_004832 [Steinernema hermaphroditum]|uniref:G-protein coupled receptors family 1 profile domain-containing protein n=1 Tax=Steinernema hermaphroditum TaxID=289476 RepID=A0AA39HPZ4_9BILA|nr:hypothetical protein QR680_004832 [Steinernema hermaphroditum]
MTFDAASIAVGSFYITLSMVILLQNVAVQYILYQSKELNTAAYRIMFQLGITGSLQVLFHSFGGVFSVADSDLHPVLEKLCGAILNAAWIGGIPFTLLLALNRLFVVCFPSRATILFSRRATTVSIVGCWVWPAVFLGIYLSPACSIRYGAEDFSWGYDSSQWSEVVADAEFYSILVMLVLTGVSYVIILAKILVLRRKTTRSFCGHERGVLLQTVLVFGYNLLCLVAWHTYDLFLPSTRWTLLAVNSMWILNGAVNPTLYLTMNKSIRKSFLNIITCRRFILASQLSNVSAIAVRSTNLTSNHVSVKRI